MYKKSFLTISILFPILLTPFQSSYADYDSFTVNIPNSQGSYTTIVIKKSGNGYSGPRGEYYSDFPTVSKLQAVYDDNTSNNGSQPTPNNNSQSNPILGWLLFLAVIGLGIPIIGIVTSCPNCKKWWIRHKVYSKEIDRSQGYKEVTRHRDHRDPQGKLIKTENWQETVPVINVTYQNYYRCSNCQYEWTEISKTQT